MLKIYTQDHSYSGMIVAVAKNEADARKIMEAAHNYYEGTPVQEHEIKEGFMEYNMGDG
jgi:hypothetical protein